MKYRLLSTCLLTGLAVTAGITSPVLAQNAKPGQRLIYDNRLPEEAPQLGKPIFNRQVTAPKADETAKEEVSSGDSTETQSEAASSPEGEEGQSAGEAGEAAQPSLYMKDEQKPKRKEQSGKKNEDSGDPSVRDRDPEQFERNFDMNEAGEIEKRLEKFDRDMPYKDLSNADFAKLPVADQQKVLQARKEYTDRYKEEIVEKARKDND